jgi:hypothetical protein
VLCVGVPGDQARRWPVEDLAGLLRPSDPQVPPGTQVHRRGQTTLILARPPAVPMAWVQVRDETRQDGVRRVVIRALTTGYRQPRLTWQVADTCVVRSSALGDVQGLAAVPVPVPNAPGAPSARWRWRRIAALQFGPDRPVGLDVDLPSGQPLVQDQPCSGRAGGRLRADG